jgi:hypothetical protein
MRHERILVETFRPTDGYGFDFESVRRVILGPDHEPSPEEQALLADPETVLIYQRQRFLHIGWRTIQADQASLE